ncbi:MAG: hypothetical protein RDV48_17500 [Candidatus Eremiobacteraeota bacterium]|nr:hypothetical protein [Candidatus Eremiobacteraeota bacterium]
MNEDEVLRSRTIEMLQDTLFFEKNIKDARLSDFQNCYREAVKSITGKRGFATREDLIAHLESIPHLEFWNEINSLHSEIHKRVDTRMNVVTELFFKGEEMDTVSRTFFQSTFQRIRRLIATAKGENIKTVTDILYRLIILSVLCQYRKNCFKDALL